MNPGDPEMSTPSIAYVIENDESPAMEKHG